MLAGSCAAAASVPCWSKRRARIVAAGCAEVVLFCDNERTIAWYAALGFARNGLFWKARVALA